MAAINCCLRYESKTAIEPSIKLLFQREGEGGRGGGGRKKGRL